MTKSIPMTRHQEILREIAIMNEEIHKLQSHINFRMKRINKLSKRAYDLAVLCIKADESPAKDMEKKK
jgi:hypothetical protein